MKLRPHCPECRKVLKLYERDYIFECPNENCGLQFGLECIEEMQQIVWIKDSTPNDFREPFS
jgi:predicted RNA-binding Zn-ribbon protein involved in translation (DUF1610 family)